MSFFKREYGGFGDMEGNMRDDMDDDMDGDLDDVFDSPFMQMFLLMEPVSREIVAAHEREGGSHCPACGEYQDSWFDLDDHIRDEFNHHVCMDCRIAFPRPHVLLEHYINDPKHFFCETCEDLFLNQKFLDWHIQQFHAYCYRCQKMLDDKNALKRHYILSDDHHYCISCDKSFDSHLDLQQHLFSSIHHPKTIRCSFKCGHKSRSRSALVNHLESGKCTSGVHRRFIEKYVRQLDTRRLITDPQLPYVGPSTYSQDGKYIATEASWNGSMFECDLCHLNFISLHNLNRHLASPRHAEKAYICRGPTCGKRFKTFSGLVNHIESSKCDVGSLNDVKIAVDGYLGQIETMEGSRVIPYYAHPTVRGAPPLGASHQCHIPTAQKLNHRASRRSTSTRHQFAPGDSISRTFGIIACKYSR